MRKHDTIAANAAMRIIPRHTDNIKDAVEALILNLEQCYRCNYRGRMADHPDFKHIYGCALDVDNEDDFVKFVIREWYPTYVNFIYR